MHNITEVLVLLKKIHVFIRFVCFILQYTDNLKYELTRRIEDFIKQCADDYKNMRPRSAKIKLGQRKEFVRITCELDDLINNKLLYKIEKALIEPALVFELMNITERLKDEFDYE